ncbi:polysaccharide pyruvyl transferase family protein [Gryllotalpicola protaetiae]|uniref:Polysaccharide pyruvyl transferase n=1 Tax=Gryllotalpicola protaetiae TaxID=2419771 RepID=A0A387BRU7_9MICO|nr:polysaccharide pyruvyl transferase family protein [Gryllotalpicola protaetiae]AYG03716.1 polysaccharide pyruvyl transferase [Gryllotalpicola protaetiae]
MRSTVAELHERASAELVDALGAPGPVDVVDFPDHLNCGDAAIWLGELVVLSASGARIRSAMSRRSFRIDALTPASTIVLQGGGNFGGLYPTHHQLRLRLLDRLRGRRIVQMPQSIEYPGERERDELRRAVSRHGAFVLLVRDHRSFDLAAADFDCEVRLVPDAAFALGTLTRRAPTVSTAVQVRTDREATGGADFGDFRFDWLQAPLTETRRRRLEWHELISRAAAKTGSARLRTAEIASAQRLAEANLARAIGLLSTGRTLVTDRLHGHILATLLGVEHLVVNDKYGKIRAFWDTWTRDIPHAHFVETWADTPAALAELTEARAEGAA